MVSGCYVYGDIPTDAEPLRSYRFFLVRANFFGGVLEIVHVEHADVYAVEELTQTEGYEPAIWRLFAVCKCDLTGNEGLYLVKIPGRSNGIGKPSCECFGYNRWQNCKHIDSLLHLCKRGQI